MGIDAKAAIVKETHCRTYASPDAALNTRVPSWIMDGLGGPGTPETYLNEHLVRRRGRWVSIIHASG